MRFCVAISKLFDIPVNSLSPHMILSIPDGYMHLRALVVTPVLV